MQTPEGKKKHKAKKQKMKIRPILGVRTCQTHERRKTKKGKEQKELINDNISNANPSLSLGDQKNTGSYSEVKLKNREKLCYHFHHHHHYCLVLKLIKLRPNSCYYNDNFMTSFSENGW